MSATKDLIALPNLPAGWEILPLATGALPPTRRGARILGLEAALAFYSAGGVTYAMTVNTTSRAITRVDTADWTAADYLSEGEQWVSMMTYEDSNNTRPAISFNCNDHDDMFPVGGIVWTDDSAAITGITDATTFTSATFDPYNEPTATPLHFTIAVKRTWPVAAPIGPAQFEDEETVYRTKVTAVLARRNPDGSDDFYWAHYRAYDNNGEREMRTIDDVSEIGALPGRSYAVSVMSNNLLTTQVERHTPFAFHSIARAFDVMNDYHVDHAGLVRIAKPMLDAELKERPVRRRYTSLLCIGVGLLAFALACALFVSRPARDALRPDGVIGGATVAMLLAAGATLAVLGSVRL